MRKPLKDSCHSLESLFFLFFFFFLALWPYFIFVLGSDIMAAVPAALLGYEVALRMETIY